jgi:metallo-beta-lactamase class B
MRFARCWLMVIMLAASVSLGAQANPDWTTTVTPFQIADNLYYVGSRDLASYLVTTSAGNILINANLASSPPQIRASVEKLGFKWADTKIFLNSQAHFDHVGGAAEVIRETHAQNMVMDGDAAVMESGGHSDFAWGEDVTTGFAPAKVDLILKDGDEVTLGDLMHGGVTLTAHKTAGHTRGCTTYTMRVHVPGEPAGQMRDVVIVGGVSALALYRLVDSPGHSASYPGITDDFEATFRTLRGLKCDIFLGAHGAYFGMLEKMERMKKEGPAVFIDPAGYRAMIDDAQRRFEAKLARQQAALKRAQ